MFPRSVVARSMTTSAVVAISCAGLLAGCFGGKDSGSSSTTVATPLNDSPTPAQSVDPCVLSVDEVKKAIGTAPSAPGQGTAFQCLYQVPAKDGAVTTFEIRVKGWVSDPGVLDTEREVRSQRTPVEVKNVGKGALVFEADPQFKDVPGFAMTNSGYATISWLPGGEPTKDDYATALFQRTAPRNLVQM